ncbi:DUF3077 domain-containing protein [Pseudomonas fluorescens]|uniref:DUF3077 domain-containing protein n=1 Tax=Pseudomonas fluorescens TaxID=294 RepID=A0AAE2Q276_PSEFL|nr:DUF3077 domain-containing protein [Pseudomonas fluorescens]
MAECQLPDVLADTLLSGASPLPQWIASKLRAQYAWAAHYLCEMGKSVVDDLTQAMTPSR